MGEKSREGIVMNTEKHLAATSKAIKSLDEFKLTPQEQIAVLKSAAAIIDHEIQASMSAQMLFKLLNK